jgi:hypothetical protein
MKMKGGKIERAHCKKEWQVLSGNFTKRPGDGKMEEDLAFWA